MIGDRQDAPVFASCIQHSGEYLCYECGEPSTSRLCRHTRIILEKRSGLKLRGLLIENGWIDPVSHYRSYLSFSNANNLEEKNSTLYDHIENQVKQCEQILFDQAHVLDKTCDLILKEIIRYDAMNNYYRTRQTGRCVNVFDICLDDTILACGENCPSDLKYVTFYLQRQDVL
ncbi:unnamed protein product [Adineta ricciae]|uniref:Uncharacterized protein n=1 Tax=Adineta ricciae TaxID=249248 RepID=A0A814X2U8_ADIRI|nr:unnamed protein product [Adineta ricciae]